MISGPEARFIGEEKNQILASFDKLFWPTARMAGARFPGDAVLVAVYTEYARFRK